MLRAHEPQLMRKCVRPNQGGGFGPGVSDYARLLVGVSIVAPLLAWLVLLAHVLGRPRPSEAPLGPEGRLVLRKIALMVVPRWWRWSLGCSTAPFPNRDRRPAADLLAF